MSDAIYPVAIGVPVGLYLYGIMGLSDDQNANRYAAESGLQSAVTIGVTYGMVVALKALFDRDRPFQAHPDCITPYDGSTDGSLPSGHSAGAAAIATTLSLRYPEWFVIGPSVLYALYTGISRLHLGMHYLSDVLTGYAIGAGIAWGINALNNELFNLADPILPAFAPSGSAALHGPSHIPIVALSFSL